MVLSIFVWSIYGPSNTASLPLALSSLQWDTGNMFFLIVFSVFLVIGESHSQTISFSPAPSDVGVEDGGTATFTCVPLVDGVAGLTLWRAMPFNSSEIIISSNGTNVLGATAYLSNDPGRTRLILTNVGQALNGAQIICRGLNQALSITAVDTPPATLSLFTPPAIAFNGPFQPVEGEDFTVSSTSYHPGNPMSSVSVNYEGFALTNGSEVVVLLSSSTLSVVFTGVHRNRSGTYNVTLTNIVGNSTASFSVDVQYPPSLMNVNVSARTVLVGEDLTLDCTPIPGNPSNLSLTFKINGSEVTQSDPSITINSFVLTITTVQRRHTGTYMCEASNGVGGPVTGSTPVNVVGPPTAPKALTVVDVTPFSARMRWSPPEDNGGVELIQYKYNISNGTTVLSGTTNSTMTTLTNLQHSTNYTVSVLAENVHGRSSQVESPFRTRDSVPIIHLVASEALSLFNITVHVTLLTTGGQSVTGFDISVYGTIATDSTMIVDDRMMTISLVVSGLNLLKGEMYVVSVTATNIVGRSDPVIGVLSVPNPPRITGNFTELSPSAITTCCSGVKLHLARPQDVSDVRVSLSVNGGPHEMVRSGDIILSGDILYISGLQAGTVYTANITVSNIFGSAVQQIVLSPLLGRPSNPVKPIVAVDSTSVRFTLSADYPGTERTRSGSMFTFQVHFDKNGCSTCQSVLDTVDVSPSSLSGASTNYRGVLEPGSYTVSVTAVNEHGNSSSVMSEQFSVQAPCTCEPQAGVDSVTTVYIIIIVVLFILLVVVTVYSVLLTIKLRRVSGVLSKQKVGGNKLEPVYDEMGMEPRPSKNEIIIDKNPAYDSVDVGKPLTATAVEYEEVGDSRHGIRTEKGTKL